MNLRHPTSAEPPQVVDASPECRPRSVRSTARAADIVEAAAEIAAIVEQGKTAWDEDRVSRLAVERLLEIIGESARAKSDDGRSSVPAVAWADVIGLRTLLAHHYHRVDPEQVWVIATVEVPRLARALS